MSRPAHLISACIIAKDEEEMIPGCLASVTGFADEVVVYDTGSTDSTVELARSMGATVIEGYWDDDFARARNSAMEHCSGEWILSIDADELLMCEARNEVRDLIEHQLPAPEGGRSIEGFQLAIENTSERDLSAGFTHTNVRMFRRADSEWLGRMHELVTKKGTGGSLVVRSLPHVRILHKGYAGDVFTSKGKVARNLRLAEAEAANPSPIGDPGYAVVNLGRALWTAGRAEEGLVKCREGADIAASDTTARFGLHMAVRIAIQLERTEEARELINKLRTRCTNQVLPNILEGTLLAAAGEHEQALEVLGRIGEFEQDDDGFEYTKYEVAGVKAEILYAMGKPSEAADELIEPMAEKGILDRHVGFLVQCLKESGRSLAEIADAMPPYRLVAFLGQAAQMRADECDEVIEELHIRWPDELAVLAAAGRIGAELSVERALVWTVRFRQAGLVDGFPLMSLAENPERDPIERVRSAGVLWKAFQDKRAPALLTPAAAALPQAQVAQARAELELICPDALDTFDQAITSSQATA